MDRGRGVWQAAVHGVAKNQTTEHTLSPNELGLGSSSLIPIFLVPFPPNFTECYTLYLEKVKILILF